MYKLYQDISLHDSFEDLLTKFLNLLSNVSIRVKNCHLLLESNIVQPYSAEEIDAILVYRNKNNCTCTVQVDIDDTDHCHEESCESTTFKFDNSLTFQIWDFDENYFRHNLVGKRYEGWYVYSNYIYLFQTFCIPLLTQLKVNHEVTKILSELLPRDLERICHAYLQHTAVFIGPIFIDVNDVVNNDVKTDVVDRARRYYQYFIHLCESGRLEDAKAWWKDNLIILGGSQMRRIFETTIRKKQFEVAQWLYSLWPSYFTQVRPST